MRRRGPGARCRVPVFRPVGVQACRAALARITIVCAWWRQISRGLTTLAPRRKPRRESMVPTGCVACGRLTPCLAQVSEFVGTGATPCHRASEQVKAQRHCLS